MSSGAGSTPVTPDPTDVGQRGVGELVRDVSHDLTKLVSQELTLAKLELKAEAGKAGKTAAAFGGAGVAGYFTALFALLTLAFALASLLDSLTLGALIVTVLCGLVAAVLFLRARKQAKTLNPKPEMTVQTLKEDAQWAQDRRR
jgi:hypothetical protein